MSTRVYGWDSNPVVDRFAYRCSNSSAAEAVRKGEAMPVIDADGRHAIQLLAQVEFSMPEAQQLGYAISPEWYLRVIKTHNVGDKLHYEMPHAGDIGLRRHGMFRRRNKEGKHELKTHLIRVSARSKWPYAPVEPATTAFASRLLAG